MMAEINEILEEIQNILTDAFASVPDEQEVFVYRDVPDVQQTPAIVIMPAPRDTADFNGAFGKGMDTWIIDIIVMVAKGEYTVSQVELAKFLGGSSPLSIRQILWQNANLGLEATDANVDGVRLYGGSFENAKIPHVGAVIKVTVRTSGA